MVYTLCDYYYIDVDYRFGDSGCHLFGRTLWRLDYTLGLACDGMLDWTIVEAVPVVPDFVLDCAADYLFECLTSVADSLLALLAVNNWSLVPGLDTTEELN